MAQRSREDGTYSEPAATREIDTRVSISVVAKHNFPRADAVGGDPGIGLKARSKIGSGTTGAGAADDFIPLSQSDCSARCAGESLRAFSNHADRRLEIDLCRVDSRVSAEDWSRGESARSGSSPDDRA